MPTASVPYVLGEPGMRAAVTASWRRIFQDCWPTFLPGGRRIDGVLTRDVSNTPYTDALQAGLVMGKVTATGLYANSFLGTLTNAEAAGSTQLEVSAASAVEIVRRIGATGTLKVTGPPVASGTVRSVTFTYSAVNTTTGAITVTAATNANQAEDVRFNIASTGGNLQLTVSKPDGTRVTTGNAAWNATDATYLAAINTALDTATGVVGGVVATAIAATDTDLGFTLTYSGTGYAGQAFVPAVVAVLPTSSTAWFVVPRTTAVESKFVAGSFVQPTDGSETPVCFLPDGPAMNVTDNANTNGLASVQFPLLPISGTVLTAQLINYPTDASLKTWLKTNLSTLVAAKYVFDDAF